MDISDTDAVCPPETENPADSTGIRTKPENRVYVKEVKRKTVRLFSGAFISACEVTGYCVSKSHPGWISKNLMKQHECLEKKCVSFRRANTDYWARIDEQERARKAAKAAIKNKINAVKARDDYIRAVFKPYTDVYITSIKDMPRGLLITYIFDRTVDLTPAVDTLKKELGCGIRLKSVLASLENRIKLIRGGRKADLLIIPGVGAATKKRLNALGVFYVEDLIGLKPSKLFKEDCRQNGKVNRNYLRRYIAAVQYAHDINNPFRKAD